jgi:hypothetical protein
MHNTPKRICNITENWLIFSRNVHPFDGFNVTCLVHPTAALSRVGIQFVCAPYQAMNNCRDNATTGRVLCVNIVILTHRQRHTLCLEQQVVSVLTTLTEGNAICLFNCALLTA